MCERCDDPSLGVHGISLAPRPAHRLTGRMWEGSYDEARTGVLDDMTRDMLAIARRQAGLFKSPVVALSWNGAGGRLRHFVGLAADDLVAGDTVIDLPDLSYASAMHGPEDGHVAARYGSIALWMRERSIRADRSHFDHREEYAPDTELDARASLRLMVPVAGDPAGF